MEEWRVNRLTSESSVSDSTDVVLPPSTNLVRRERRGDRFVFVKRYQNDSWDATPDVIARRVELEIATLRRISEQTDWHQRLGKVRLVEADADGGMIVTEEVPGVPLSHTIHHHCRNDDRSSLGPFYLAGKWIKRFQQLEVTDAACRRIGEKNPTNLSEYLQIRINELKRMGYRGLRDEQWDAIIEKVDRLDAEIQGDDRALVMCHNDYSPGNIISDGYLLTPIDFQMTAPGSPLLDVAYFLHRLEMTRVYRPWLRRPWGRWRDAFIAGYGRENVIDTPLYQSLVIRLYVLRLLTYVREKPGRLKQRLHNRWVLAAVRHKLLRKIEAVT